MAAALKPSAAAAGSAPPPLAPLPTPPSAFPTHRDAPPGSLDPRAFAICEILASVPQADLETHLSRSGILLLPSVVDAVLRHSYSNPAAAVRFFRWAALTSPHSPSSWNLMVDLLGKNSLFEAMWDAIRSMRDEPSAPLSTTTFVSAFDSYCAAGRVKEAVLTFDVMDRYGVAQTSFAVNALLSAICRCGGHAAEASEFFKRIRSKIPPDADTFAILLEAWEKEGDADHAMKTFGEMIVQQGWDPKNMAAHEMLLSTLFRGGKADEAVKFLQVMETKGCFPGMKLFANALDVLARKDDFVHTIPLWDIMVGHGLVPDTVMYNAMIAMRARHRDFTSAFRLLDEMPLKGTFPDSITYNTILECLLTSKRVREAEKFLNEMRKNEQQPTSENCVLAIRTFFDQFDPDAALGIWSYVMRARLPLLEECANELLVGLRELGRMSDVRSYADEILNMRITLNPSTMAKLKSGFQKAGTMHNYDTIERRLRAQ